MPNQLWCFQQVWKTNCENVSKCKICINFFNKFPKNFKIKIARAIFFISFSQKTFQKPNLFFLMNIQNVTLINLVNYSLEMINIDDFECYFLFNTLYFWWFWLRYVKHTHISKNIHINNRKKEWTKVVCCTNTKTFDINKKRNKINFLHQVSWFLYVIHEKLLNFERTVKFFVFDVYLRG